MGPDPQHALRVTLTYDGSRIDVVGAERIAMVVPASAAAPRDGQTGYWFALLDDQGRAIYLRPLHQPIRVDREVFVPDNARSITRVPGAPQTGSFTVLVPDLSDARAFALHGPRDPWRAGDAASEELVRSDVDRLRRMKPPTPVPDTGAPTPPVAPAERTPPSGRTT
ncbi:MAG: hypothetical protein ABI533_02745 [Betaproteobacteria bacterium]